MRKSTERPVTIARKMELTGRVAIEMIFFSAPSAGCEVENHGNEADHRCQHNEHPNWGMIQVEPRIEPRQLNQQRVF